MNKIKIIIKINDTKLDSLALAKGYSAMIGEEVNSQSAVDYLRQVYEGIVMNDLANEYLKAHKNLVSSSIVEAENNVRATAVSDIESSIL